MKKVLIGAFAHESNDFCKNFTTEDMFEVHEGNRVLELLPVRDIFEDAGIEVIPSIYAQAQSYGKVSEAAYLSLERKILKTVEENPELDGVWMFCHGAMSVENIGSGEYRLMSKIRSLVSEHCVISLGMDLHGNIEEAFSSVVNIFRCYHTAPHTDQVETYRKTASALVNALVRGEFPQTQMVKIPMIFPGEMAATTISPFKEIISELKRLENEDAAVECASMFIGFAWADAPRTSSTVAIVPSASCNNEHCKKESRRIADWAFSQRKSFGFEMESYDAEESAAIAISSEIYPVCITDMGDNPTAGTNGGSLCLLKSFLDKASIRRILIAGLYDPTACEKCRASIGTSIDLNIGIDIDEPTKPISLDVDVLRIVDVKDYDIETNPATVKCSGALVRHRNIDIIITDRPFAFIHKISFASCGIIPTDYEILVTKFGYIYPDLKEIAKRYIMANTPGESYQNITELKYSHLKHPVYPFDEI